MKKITISIFVAMFFLLFNPFEALSQQDSTIHQYSGTYDFTDEKVGITTVSVENGALTLYAGFGTGMLTPVGIDSFAISGHNGGAVFMRGRDGKIITLQIRTQDINALGIRRGTVAARLDTFQEMIAQ